MINFIEKDGENQDAFDLNVTGLPWTLSGGGSNSFTVSFTPITTGIQTASIVINSVAPSSDWLSVAAELASVQNNVTQPSSPFSPTHDSGVGGVGGGNVTQPSSSRKVAAELGPAVQYRATHDVSLQGTGIPPVPNPAINPIPEENATDVAISQNLTWSSAQTGSTPTGYKIYFEATNPPTTMHTLGDVNTWTPTPALQHNTTYFWRVVPFNATGDALDCPIWSFTTAPSPPNLDINPVSHHFGEIVIGQTSATQTLTVTNTGDLPLIVDSIEKEGSNDDEFNLDTIGLPWTIETGTVRDFTVSFSPISVGNKQAVLSITHNASESPFAVSLTAVAIGLPEFSINPTSHNFGAISVGETSATQNFTIRNTGGSTLTINSISKDGINIDEFNLSASGFPWTIVANGNRIFSVSFEPSSEGTKEVNIKITHSAPDTLFLVDLKGDGTVSESDIVAAKTELLGNYPNPFNPSTSISFIVSGSSMRSGVSQEGTHVRIEIYDIKGAKVTTVTDGVFSAGLHTVEWNGFDSSGREVGSGIYFYRMQTDEYVSVRRMILLK